MPVYPNPGPNGSYPANAQIRPDGSYYKFSPSFERSMREQSRGGGATPRMNPSSYAGAGFTVVLILIIVVGFTLMWLAS